MAFIFNTCLMTYLHFVCWYLRWQNCNSRISWSYATAWADRYEFFCNVQGFTTLRTTNGLSSNNCNAMPSKLRIKWDVTESISWEEILRSFVSVQVLSRAGWEHCAGIWNWHPGLGNKLVYLYQGRVEHNAVAVFISCIIGPICFLKQHPIFLGSGC